MGTIKSFKKFIEESIWSDMQDRSAGDTVRKEDERHKILERLLATYIKLFAENCYYHDEYAYSSYPDFISYIKDFRDNPRIEEVCPNNSYFDDLLDYVNKETWDNQIFDTIVKISLKIVHGEHPITDDVIEELRKHNVNESIWSDMQDRSSGDVVRKEDEMSQEDFDAVDDFIFGFATRVVWDGMKYSLTNFLKYIDENPESLDCDIKRVKKYVEDNWRKGICDDIEAAIEREEKEREQVMYESIWSDMQDRSAGDTVRKEDEMNDYDFLMLRKTAKMFRNSYVYRGNTCDDFIKYIERRKEEHFWTSVSDEVYDKVIRFVQKNWGDCTGIQEFMDKYLSNINECDGVPGGLTPADVGGMGPAYFPGPNGEPGSGDLPSPTGIVYKQVAPFDSFIKIRKQKKKKKKFRKEDELCVHSENPPIYSHVDDFRDYVDRTYDNIDKKK